MLQFIIEPRGIRPRTQIRVDETTLIGACVASLVERLDYPKVDSTGRPVTYQLRVVPSGKTLPNALHFAETQIASGTHLVLETDGANEATVPVEAHAFPPRVSVPRMDEWRGSRRSLLVGGAGIAGLGLVSGLGTAFAQRSLVNPLQGRPGGLPATEALQGATARLTFSGHQQTVRAVAWSPDGSMLASGADDAHLLVWSPDGMILQRIAHLAPVQSLAWSPESQRVVSGSTNQVTFFTALTGAILARRARHTAPVTSVQWTRTNQMQVVSGALDKQAIVWETTQYQAQAVFAGHNTPIESVSWAADGQTVASASQGGAVRVWNAETSRELHGLYQDAQTAMRACAFNTTGTLLAVGGNDGVIRLWNGLVCQQQQTGNGGLMCQDTPERLSISKNAIRSVAWSPDGQHLASGDQDGTLTLWRPAQSQNPIFTKKLNSPLHSIAWAPNGKRLATGVGTTIILWDLIGMEGKNAPHALAKGDDA